MADYTPNKCDCGRTIYTEKQYSCDECFQSNKDKDVWDNLQEQLFVKFTDQDIMEYIRNAHKDRFLDTVKEYIKVYFPNIKGLKVDYLHENEIINITFDPGIYTLEEVQRKIVNILQYAKH
jgi:hypothetical protein